MIILAVILALGGYILGVVAMYNLGSGASLTKEKGLIFAAFWPILIPLAGLVILMLRILTKAKGQIWE